MAALPYMPLYVADYLADTAHLGAVEHGAYLLLIMNYWQRGKPLPADDVRLARIARVDASQWPSVRAQIEEFFSEEDGEWVHKRIDAELARVAEKSAKAKASAKRTPSVGSANAQRTLSERSADDERSLIYTDTDTDKKERGARARNLIFAKMIFPEDGSIEFGRWAEIARKEAPGRDVDAVASAFRGFCRMHDIPFDKPGIEKSFATFAGKFGKTRAA